MSRFEEVVNEAIDEVVLGEAFKAETLAAHIAERVRDRQDGCAPRSRSPRAIPSTSRRRRPARRPRRSTRCSARRWPPSAAPAGSSASQAQGMTACPCAQEMVDGALARAPARRRLHRRRDRARVRGGAGGHPQPARHRHAATSAAPRAAPSRVEAADAAEIVEASMSSEIYELMKRPDEVEVVEKAHRRPRFVEDCVREMVRMATERFAVLGDDAFLLGAPGEPRDDPQAQRGGRAPRPDGRAARARSNRASSSAAT